MDLPVADSDAASRPASAVEPEAEEDAPTYRVPAEPPAHRTVTVNRDGTFIYTPAPDGEDSSSSPPG